MSKLILLGSVQTSNFSCAESNANELEQTILLICIRFGTWKVWRLNWALMTKITKKSSEILFAWTKSFVHHFGTVELIMELTVAEHIIFFMLISEVWTLFCLCLNANV